MTPQERAEQINREEREAERADLMRRALAYAAQKRAHERARALGGNEPVSHAPMPAKPRRMAKLHDHRGAQRTLASHANHYGIRYQLLKSRLSKGWTLAAALETPVREYRGRDVSPRPIRLDLADRPKGPGVPSGLGPLMGTGAGSTARETTNITFPRKAEAQ